VQVCSRTCGPSDDNITFSIEQAYIQIMIRYPKAFLHLSRCQCRWASVNQSPKVLLLSLDWRDRCFLAGSEAGKVCDGFEATSTNRLIAPMCECCRGDKWVALGRSKKVRFLTTCVVKLCSDGSDGTNIEPDWCGPRTWSHFCLFVLSLKSV